MPTRASPCMHVSHNTLSYLSLYVVIICFLFSLLFIKKPFCIPCNYFTILQFSSRPLHVVGMECLHWEHSNHKWMPFCALVRWDDSQSWVLLRSTCRLKPGCVELLVAPHVLCDPMACSRPGSSVRGNSPGQNTGVGCHSLLQGNPPYPEIEPVSPPLQADFFSVWATRGTIRSGKRLCQCGAWHRLQKLSGLVYKESNFSLVSF